MPRKGEYRRTERTVETLPSAPRIGLRRVEGFDSNGGPGASTLDPAAYVCARLAGELADEWVELAATSQQGFGTARCYRRAIDVFCRFVDATHGRRGSGVAGARQSGSAGRDQ